MAKQEALFSEFKVDSGAEFSTCRKYRYALWRIWDRKLPFVMFIGLNPSTANEFKADPTINKVEKISRNNGYGGFYMMNCFPYVTAYPNELLDFFDTPFHDKEDMKNITNLLRISQKCKAIVFAWGDFKQCVRKGEEISKLFGNQALCLKINKKGSPKHPLYCKDDTEFIKYIQI